MPASIHVKIFVEINILKSFMLNGDGYETTKTGKGRLKEAN